MASGPSLALQAFMFFLPIRVSSVFHPWPVFLCFIRGPLHAQMMTL
jgi:hypothetical protein